jgi:hypothetical protein
MIRFLTYSEENMTRSRMLCAETARKHGADMVFEYEPHNIDKEFYENNKEILDAKFCESGTRPCAGYWLWKPYFINRVMNKANDGDYVVYVDAGCEIINNLQHIADAMDQDIFLFTNGMMHRDWCKGDVMQNINHEYFSIHDPTYFNYQQVQASAMWIKVTPFSRKFIKEWLLWCQMPGMIDDSPSIIPNHPEFANHRYDQSIITCLSIKYNIKLHFWPDAKWFSTQRHRWPGDDYPLMFLHHRFRNSDY